MNKKIITQGLQIAVIKDNEEEYISLTDMAKFKDREAAGIVIANWLSTKYTIQFMSVWEHVHNPNFKHIEFDVFKNQAGANSFSLTPKRWIESVNAIGLINKAGRYGGNFRSCNHC